MRITNGGGKTKDNGTAAYTLPNVNSPPDVFLVEYRARSPGGVEACQTATRLSVESPTPNRAQRRVDTLYGGIAIDKHQGWQHAGYAVNYDDIRGSILQQIARGMHHDDVPDSLINEVHPSGENSLASSIMSLECNDPPEQVLTFVGAHFGERPPAPGWGISGSLAPWNVDPDDVYASYPKTIAEEDL